MNINNFSNKIQYKSQIVNNNQNQNQKPITSTAKTPQQPTKKSNFVLDLAYVNDFHAQLSKMQRIITPLQKYDIRVSGGDNYLGDEQNINLNRGVTKYMNLANIDLSDVGNHELDMPQKSFMDVTSNLKTKLLDANYRQIPEITIKDEAEGKKDKALINDRFKNSTVVNIKGENVGFIGVSPIDMNDRYAHADYYDDCEIDSFEDTVKDVQKEVEIMKKANINKVVLLSHLGYKVDQRIAPELSGVDVIVGGHSHNLVKDIKEGENLLKDKDGNPTIITNAGKDGNYFGNIKVEFNENGTIKSAQNNIFQTKDYSTNLVYKHILEASIGNQEKVGEFSSVLPEPEDKLIEENPQANFIADAIKNELGVEIAMLNSANLRSNFEKGRFSNLDAKMISPFNNKMTIVNVTEKDLVDAYKFTAKNSFSTHRPGLFAVSGLKYSVRKSDGELLSMSKVDDKGIETPIDINNPSATKTYRISADSFVMRGGDKVTSLNYEGREEKVFDFDKDKLICDYIKKQNAPVSINESHTGRVNIV